MEKRRILIIDDNADTHEFLEMLLRDEFNVISATTSSDGLRRFRNGWFDLILLDVWMPDVDGFELCRRIRRLDRRIPIVFYSAAAREADRQAGLAAGANAYLCKPDAIDELVETLVQLLSDWENEALEAKKAEITAIRDEIAQRRIEINGVLDRARARKARLEDKIMILKSRQAFLNAGGTKAQFRRLYPETFKEAANSIAETPISVTAAQD